MRIRNLELRARTVVEGFLSGLHRSPYHGFSVEFSEYRGYTPGDDLRRLDWRVFARTDRYFVKRFEDETNVRCHLLVDLSRSMSYGSGAVTKADYAKTAAATLAHFLAGQRDSVGLTTFADRVLDVLPARYRPGHLHRLLQHLEHAECGEDTDLGAPLEQVARLVRKRGIVVLISDLLSPLKGLTENLGALRFRGHEVVLLRILDRREKDFDLEKPSLVHDLESGRQIYVDPVMARAGYRERFKAHETELQSICADHGVDLHELVSDQPLERVLFDFLHARQRRGRRILRRHDPGRRSPGSGGAT